MAFPIRKFQGNKFERPYQKIHEPVDKRVARSIKVVLFSKCSVDCLALSISNLVLKCSVVHCPSLPVIYKEYPHPFCIKAHRVRHDVVDPSPVVASQPCSDWTG